MIYLQGNIYDPDTWYIAAGQNPACRAFKEFETKKQARSWVIEEIKRRCKAMNRVKHAWQERKVTDER
jgi:hypothetical protein